MALTKASYSLINGAPVNVLDYGADSTGVADSTQAIKDALAESTSIWFPAGTYLVSSTIRSEVAVFINGEENVIIKAVAPFTGIAVTDGGSPVSLKAVFAIFDGSTINDITGARISAELEAASKIGPITIDCDQVADYGLFIERAPYTEAMCNVFSAANTGIWSGVYCWGVRLEQNKILDCVTNGVFLGTAANGVTLDNVNIWGYPTRTVNAIQSNGNNNGVFINGGFVERCEIGVYITDRPGPHTLTGMDFEAHSLYCIKVEHDIGETRRGGPITILNCYLDSTEEDIWNDNCYVSVDGCRIRAPATTSGSHFYSNNTYSQFVVKNTSFDGSGGTPISPNFSETDTVAYEKLGQDGIEVLVKGWNTGVTYAPTYEIDQYGFGADKYKTFQSGYLDFQTSNQGGASDQFISRSTWFVQRVIDSGTPAATQVGVKLEGGAGSIFGFVPLSDNDRVLGSAANRWSVVYAGTGTINTSDANEKQQVRLLDDAEKTVALNIKGLIKAFKFNDAVALKGDNARVHVGAVAQEVAQAFADSGLDPAKYALFCKDEWHTLNGEIVLANADGVYPEGSIKHERLGLRYEQMLAFVIAAI
jgi:hypothetical protein